MMSQYLDQLDLVLGGHPRNHANLVDAGFRVGLAQRAEFLPGHHLAANAKLAGDRLGGDRVVSGDHAHLHPCTGRLRDRGFGLGPWRIDDADQGQQRQVADERE